jgi:phage anti-repressor protein
MSDEVTVVEKKDGKLNELFKVVECEGKQMVDARALHKTLGVKARFNDWIKSKIGSLDLKEGMDYTATVIDSVENRGKHNREDYVFTKLIAYKIVIIENTAKSNEVIEYFIKLDQAWNTSQLVTRRALELSGHTYEHQRTAIKEADKYCHYVWKNLPVHEGQRPGRNLTMAAKGLYERVNDLLAINEMFNLRHSQHTIALGMLQDLIGISSDQLSKFKYAEQMRVGWDVYINIRGLADREDDEWYKVMDYCQLPTDEERKKRRKVINEKDRDDCWEHFALKENELQDIRDEVTEKAVKAKRYIEARIKEAEMLEEEDEAGAEERQQLEAKDRELAAKDWDSLKTDEERKEVSDAIRRLADKEFDEVHGLERGEDGEPSPYCEGTGRSLSNGY